MTDDSHMAMMQQLHGSPGFEEHEDMKAPYTDILTAFSSSVERNARYELHDLNKLAADIYALGYRKGQEEMRERSSQKAGGWLNDPESTSYGTDFFDQLAAAIRALPLEDPKT